MPPKKEWIGKHIDKLTVVKELEPYRSPTGKSTRRFLCLCDCGAETVQLQSTLGDKRRYHQCPECSGRDWSNDFFDAGLLPYDDETETHTVQDVGYCIEAAEEWAAEDDDNCVSVDDI